MRELNIFTGKYEEVENPITVADIVVWGPKEGTTHCQVLPKCPPASQSAGCSCRCGGCNKASFAWGSQNCAFGYDAILRDNMDKYVMVQWGEDGSSILGPYTKEELKKKIDEFAKENSDLKAQYRHNFIGGFPTGDPRTMPSGAHLILKIEIVVPKDTVVIKQFELPD